MSSLRYTKLIGAVRRVLHVDYPPNKEQRENLLHTRCNMGENTCNVIIDSGSCTNVIALKCCPSLT